MESLEKMIDKFHDILNDTRGLGSIIDSDVFDSLSKSDENLRDRLINSSMQSNSGTSVRNISESEIPESMILKNVENQSNDDDIDNRENNFEHVQDQMNATYGNLDRDLQSEESLCTQCKIDTKLSNLNNSGKPLVLRARTDFSNNEVRTSDSEDLANVKSGAIEVLECRDRIINAETKIMTRQLSSSLSFSPTEEPCAFMLNLTSAAKENSSLQLSSLSKISPKNLIKHVADYGNDEIRGRTELDKKQFPRKRSLPILERSSTIHVTHDLFCRSQVTPFSNFNRSKSEENIVSIKRKRVSNTCERIEPVIFSPRNVQQKLKFLQAQQYGELADSKSSNYDVFDNECLHSDQRMIKNTPIHIPMLRQVQFTIDDESELIKSVGDKSAVDEEKINHVEALSSGTSCAFGNIDKDIVTGYKNVENVGSENKIGFMSLQSTIKEMCYMNIGERSFNVVPETSIRIQSEKIRSSKDVQKNTSVGHFGNLEEDVDTVRNEKSDKKNIDLINTSDSFLEFSVESELDRIEKESAIEIGDKYDPIGKISDLTIMLSSDENSSHVDAKRPIEPADSAVVGKNSFSIGDCEVKTAATGIADSTDAPSNSDAGLVSDKNFDKVYNGSKDEEMSLENIDGNNFSADPTILNVASTNDPTISNGIVRSPADDFSSQFPSEAQLEEIEKEALVRDKERKVITGNQKQTNIGSVVNEKDVFYKPDNVNSIAEKYNDTLPIPNWVTSPAPEPNYDKMRQTNWKRRECIKKMLHEILRLSAIITKMGNIINEKSEDKFQLRSRTSSQIPDSYPVPDVKKNLQNKLVDLGSFAGINSIGNCSDSVENKSEKSNLFYVPGSSESSYNAPPVFTKMLPPHHQLANFGASSSNAGIIDANLPPNIVKQDKFYKPQTIGISNYDSIVTFDDRYNAKYEADNVLSNCNTKFVDRAKDLSHHNASLIFSSLKGNSNDFDFENRNSGTRSAWYNNEKKGNKFCQKQFESISTSKTNTKLQSFNVPVSCENDPKVIQCIGKIKTNAKPFVNIFYSPEEPSSSFASNNTLVKNNYTNSLGTKNAVNVASHSNVTTQSSLRHIESYKSRQPNLASNSTSLQARHANDNGIFYNGITE